LKQAVGGRQPQNMPRPCALNLWHSDRESGYRVTCDMGYLCANFGLPRPLCSSYSRCTRQMDIRQKQLYAPVQGRAHNYVYHSLYTISILSI